MQENVKTENLTKEKPKKAKKKPSILFKVNKKGLHVSPCMSFLRTFILPLVRFFFPFRYYGNKKVANGACLYVSNHYRMIDPMYILPTTKEGVHFIAKAESKKMPVFGAIISAVKTIFVGRDGTDARAIMDALKCLKSGERLLFIPKAREINPISLSCRLSREALCLPSARKCLLCLWSFVERLVFGVKTLLSSASRSSFPNTTE